MISIVTVQSTSFPVWTEAAVVARSVSPGVPSVEPERTGAKA